MADRIRMYLVDEDEAVYEQLVSALMREAESAWWAFNDANPGLELFSDWIERARL
jgi:hypothetical protein